MSSNTDEARSPPNVDVNEPQTQMSISEEVRYVLSENLQLRENLKGTISSLEEHNFSTEAEIYNLKQQNVTLWANVKRENAESERLRKEIEKLKAEYKLERVKRDEISNKHLSIRLAEHELDNSKERVLADINRGECEAVKIFKEKEALKREFERFNIQFGALGHELLQDRQKCFDEFNRLREEIVKDEDRPLKLAHVIASEKNALKQLILEFKEIEPKINHKNKIILEARNNRQLIKERIGAVQNEIIAKEKFYKEAALKLEKRNAELQKGNSVLEEAIEKTKISMQQLNNEKIDVVSKVEMINIANNNINGRIASLNEKISSLLESESSLQDGIENLQKSIEPLIEVEVQHEELTVQLQTMQDKDQELSTSISCKKLQLEDLQDEHVDVQKLLDSMKQRSEDMVNETEEAKQHYNEMASSLAEKEEQQDAEMKRFRDTLDDILAIIKERETQIIECRTVDEELSTQITNTKTLIQKLTGEKEDIENKLEILFEKSKIMEQTLLDEQTSHHIESNEKLNEVRQVTAKIESIGNLSEELQVLEREYNELVEEKFLNLEKFKETRSKAEIEMKMFMKEKNKLTSSLERQYEVAENELLESKTKFLHQISEIKKRIETLTSEREALGNKMTRYNQLKESLKKQCAGYERMMVGIKNELSVTKRDIYNVINQERK